MERERERERERGREGERGISERGNGPSHVTLMCGSLSM